METRTGFEISGHFARALRRAALGLLAGCALALPAGAQPGAEPTAEPDILDAAPRRPRGAAETIVEEILITGTKKSESELAQSTPIAVSVFSGEQLEAIKVRDIESLSYSMPNVTLDSVGTTKGVANFTIRGLGINSSIPSIDPTVGVFVDGMYLGVNNGVVFDTFDLEAVEVLRGPQGLLFGRNVTGGAVLLRTKRPPLEWESSVKGRVESGPEGLLAASVGGPLIDDVLYGKLTFQYREDEGWFENDAGSDRFGEEEVHVVRPVFTLTPTDDFELTFIYEHNDTQGQGPAAQNRGFLGTFDFRIDEEGLLDFDSNHAILEANWDVEFGNGKITNIFGWRDLSHLTRIDVDGRPTPIFHADALTEQDQFSNELRYAGTFFDRWDVTAGFYFFTQDILYRERRRLGSTLTPFPTIDSTMGGNQDQKTYAVFSQSELEILPGLELIAGIRYTYEKKDVKIATFIPSTAASRCDFGTKACTFNFFFDDSWENLIPKAGLQWWATDEIQLYGHYTKGFRSGGFNFRNTSPTAPSPGPFDDEEQQAFEVGMKSRFLDGRVRFNLAAFYNYVKDLQRELNVPDMTVGVVQIIRNTADARIYGFEADVTALVQDNFAVTASLGYTEGDYENVKFDLNGDGMVNKADEDLELPRLANWSVNLSGTYDQDLSSWGILTLRGSYAYRDDSFFTDNNLGTLPDGHVIDASLAFTPDQVPFWPGDAELSFSLYGKNLLNEPFRGGDTILPPTIAGTPAGGTFSPLKEGRTFGFEARVDFR